MLAISYMGTKRPLAPIVAEMAIECQNGPFLDLFSGMCAVGQQLSSSRQVWSNDLQEFASLVAKCQFCSAVEVPDAEETRELLYARFAEAFAAIERERSREMLLERDALDRLDGAALLENFESRIFTANRIKAGTGTRYRLFSERYASTYFSIRQCAEIDALRYAIDEAFPKGGEHDWLLVAFCAALSRSANTTGHFAQPLAPKTSNLPKLSNQFNRSIWEEFRNALCRLASFGTSSWRECNRVFKADALQLLQAKDQLKGVGLVYADPPYTADQYSRYYHLYETLILYDYPAARGRGLYRDGRAVSSFSHSAKVATSMERLIAAVRANGADLILSYPSNGLLPNSREQIVRAIRQNYGREPDVIPIVHNHSTMGASKGSATQRVVEILYRARVGNGAT